MIFQLTGGMVLYSETAVRQDGDVMVFKARETCLITVSPPRNGQAQFQIQRADKSPYKAAEITVPWREVVLMHDVTDPSMLASIKSELSGLIIPITN